MILSKKNDYFGKYVDSLIRLWHNFDFTAQGAVADYPNNSFKEAYL
jgi:hypothetical protein